MIVYSQQSSYNKTGRLIIMFPDFSTSQWRILWPLQLFISDPDNKVFLVFNVLSNFLPFKYVYGMLYFLKINYKFKAINLHKHNKHKKHD